MTKALPVHVTVVIPTRNEEEAIVDTIRSIPNDGWCDRLDFLIIYGNSTDRTRELAEGEGATVYLEPRKGYGRAYKTGFSMAHGDIIVTMDADCTYPGEEVPGLVRKLVEEDLAWISCDRLRRAEEGS
ncbi:MAG: glycosyltransferase family 2 protein, partial [Candidatus Thermoplasmatota archaeon]|nr:glycosyltransferase family 2 protein [Candidatus Thermoplasmatota archaeon]